ncbi:MAG: hypothetical protein KAH44_06010 [Oricola sp.]|jgi:hypothetical protein|nr:hypothetical protein [Oricola sp.]
MLLLVAAMLVSASKSEVPPDVWACSNDVEVWCAVDSCAARPEGESTPMAIAARSDGAFSVCAYTGCWEGETEATNIGGRLVWAADRVPFSSRPEGGFEADVTLLIVAAEGVGFVRVGGIASPLLCQRRPVDEGAGE